MAPPTFGDVGKTARDLFNKGYNFGFFKVETTTKSGTGVEFKTNASQNSATGKVFGAVDVKYKIPEYGVTLTEKWNTDNTLGTEVTIEDQLYKGLKLTFESSFTPNVGKRTAKAKCEFAHQHVRLTSDATLDFAGPLVNAGIVAGHEGWLLGYSTGFDTARSKLTHHHLIFGRELGNYGVHTFVNDGNEFGGTIYHKVNSRLELGANLGWTSGDQSTRFGLAGKYQLDADTSVRAKLANTSQLAVGLTHALKPGLKLTLSALLNVAAFNEGGHKVGLGIEYEG